MTHAHTDEVRHTQSHNRHAARTHQEANESNLAHQTLPHLPSQRKE